MSARNRSRRWRRAQQARQAPPFRVDQLLRAVPHLRVLALGVVALAAMLTFVIVLAAPRDNASPSDGRGWIHINSTAPGDVLAAVRSSSLYQEADAAQSPLGDALRNDALGAPVLVHAFHPAPGQTDVWVVPVHPSAGGSPQTVALLDFAYDAANSRIRALSVAGPFVPSDPEYGKPFPQISVEHARAALLAARGSAVASSAAPELIYFPADLARIASGSRPTGWTAGGQFPDLAVWRIAGADGQDYIVGTDGKALAASALPLATDASK